MPAVLVREWPITKYRGILCCGSRTLCFLLFWSQIYQRKNFKNMLRVEYEPLLFISFVDMSIKDLFAHLHVEQPYWSNTCSYWHFKSWHFCSHVELTLAQVGQHTSGVLTGRAHWLGAQDSVRQLFLPGEFRLNISNYRLRFLMGLNYLLSTLFWFKRAWARKNQNFWFFS